MTNWPTLFANSTLAEINPPQIILTSLHGRRIGLGSTGGVITEPGISATSTASGAPPMAYPLRPEGGSMVTATTADVIGNFGKYNLSSTATPALFTLADPVPGSEVDLNFSCAAATAVKLVANTSDVSFASSSTAFALNLGSSLFFADASITLIGQSTGQYRVKASYNRNGSTILPTFTTG